jgi:mRNA-capping enzyme
MSSAPAKEADSPAAKRARLGERTLAGDSLAHAFDDQYRAAQQEARLQAAWRLPPPGHRLALPDGWLDCPKVGSSVFCEALVPCKVPLGQQFNEVLTGPLASDRFTPADAVLAVEALPDVLVHGRLLRPRAVAMIDLTKTERYYTPELEGLTAENGMRHFKLPCAGSDGPPTPSEVNTFMYLVQTQLQEAQMLCHAMVPPVQPVILVHCTHGFNRTGAMLVHYAMRRKDARPDVLRALESFQRCREPGIYKDGYISGALPFYHARHPSLRAVASPTLT